MANKVLFLLAHPNLRSSRANRLIGDIMKHTPGVTYRALYDLYPYFHIDVLKEKLLLVEHDLIVFQHPLYWYHMPPLLKLWLDEVLEMGFAYGPGGDKLKGKKILVSVTAGGSEEAYARDGMNRYKVEDFLLPWDQTANLCRMQWMPPLIFHSSMQAEAAVLETHAKNVQNKILEYIRG